MSLTEPSPPSALVVPPELEPWNKPYKTWLADNDKHFDGIASAALVFHPARPSSDVTEETGTETETRVLLLQRAPHDSMPLRWEPPGGAVDPEDGSIPLGCARELREEAGLAATRVLRLVERQSSSSSSSADVFTNRTGRRIFCRFTFEVEVRRPENGEVPEVRLDPEEHVDFYWAARDEVEQGRRRDGTEMGITSVVAREILLRGFDLRS